MKSPEQAVANNVFVTALDNDEQTPKPRRKPEERGRWFQDHVKTPLKETVYDKYICEGILRQKPLPPSKLGRRIPLEASHSQPLVDERRGHAFVSNSIRSSRYTILTFLPKQFAFQATRLANFYFICIGVPQTIPGFSTTGSYTTILPLCFFLLLTIAKEGYDDYRRHRLDEVENNTYATVLREKQHVSHTQAFGKNILRSLSHALDATPVLNKIRVKLPKPRHDEETDEDENFRWAQVKWHNIKVGDMLKLRRDDPVPADVALLCANGEDGLAYVETMALDGETNLKSKQAPKPLRVCSDIKGIQACSAEFVVEDPNRNLYDFTGSVNVKGERLPLTLNDVLMRGSVLRNTGQAIGMVINTGEECKIRMNANHHPDAKKPRLERITNQVVLTLILYVVMLSVGCSMGYVMWRDSYEEKAWYLTDATVPYKQILIGYLIMFNNIIPLALYISLEIVKVGQMVMISGDLAMYHEETNTPMTCNTNTILENLGQVSYLLSDKTGTLTENLMKYRGLSVAGTTWMHPLSKEERKEAEGEIVGEAPRKSFAVERNNSVAGKAGPEQTNFSDGVVVQEYELSDTVTPSSSRPSGVFERSSLARRSTDGRGQMQPQLMTPDLLEYIRAYPDAPFSQKAREFILGIALCHTALPEIKSDGDIDFQASSPDELALVRAAHELGFLVQSRTGQSITLREFDDEGEEKLLVYDVLDVIEFSSKRKRMSIIVRCPDGKIWLLCKGADSIIVPRLKQSALATRKSHEVRRSVQIERDLQRKSEQCTPRTSFAAGRVSLTVPRHSSLDIRPAPNRNTLDVPRMSRSEKPYRKSVDAKSSKRNKYALLDDPAISDDAEVFTRCFKHLDEFATEGLRTLIFAHKSLSEEEYTSWKKSYQEATTALVDRQQRIEDVGEAIEQGFELLGATAIEDKLQKGVPETIEKLRRANIKIWMLTGDKRETAINIAHSARICLPTSEVFILDSTKGDLKRQLLDVASDLRAGTFHKVAVIDGTTLGEVEASRALSDLFYSLILLIDSVICCRASPAQKANIVKAIRARMSGLTMAIGDGANDISMITSSHVGVGISGKEGLQAARVADFSIAQFRFLQPLLLVHGRWNYIRTAKFILWTYWKEIFFYQFQVQLQRYVGFSGSSLFENWSLTVLNTLFTSLCTIIPGVYEQDLSAETLLAVPELYEYGQRSRGLNIPQYLVWAVYGTAQGLLCWYVVYYMYGRNNVTGDSGMYAIGHLCFTLAIMWTNIKLLVLDTHAKTSIVAFSFFITTTGWWAWSAFLAGAYSDNLSPFDVKGGFDHGFGRDPVWWLTLIVALAILTAVELIYKSVRRTMAISGRWPPWKPGSWKRNGVVGEWDLTVWQEMERDPVARRRLRGEAGREGVEYGEDDVVRGLEGVLR